MNKYRVMLIRDYHAGIDKTVEVMATKFYVNDGILFFTHNTHQDTSFAAFKHWESVEKIDS